jgi:hypothetical protein
MHFNHEWLGCGALWLALAGCAYDGGPASPPVSDARVTSPDVHVAQAAELPTQPSGPVAAPRVAGMSADMPARPTSRTSELPPLSSAGMSAPAAGIGAGAPGSIAAAGSVAGRAALPNAGAAAPPPDSALEEVIGIDWELAGGQEQYLCVRRTAAKDVFAKRLRGEFPVGTHHTSLMIDEGSTTPDGSYSCGLTEIGTRIISGGGPGTQDVVLPEGVAMGFHQGSQLLLQLHLFNVSDAPIHGHNGTLVLAMDRADVKYEAEGVAAQLIALSVPPGRSSHTGRCTFDRAQTLLGFVPHMHGTGRHAKVVLHTAAHADVLLHDGDYEFGEQRAYRITDGAVASGDYLEYTCDYDNTSNATKNFGEGTLDEMCLIGMTRYPSGGSISCLW